MKEFFDTMYGWTSIFYGTKLDTFMFTELNDSSGNPLPGFGVGYLHCGIALIVLSLIVSLLFYYVFAPVRKQYFWWFVFAGINAIINFIFAVWYTLTPLVNNEVPQDAAWTEMDGVMFAITNSFWSFIFFVIAAFILKWKSIDKYVPFKFF